MTKVLIIGAGHAGGSAAALLRQYGFDGEIVLAGGMLNYFMKQGEKS